MCGFAGGALSISTNTERNFHFFGVEGYNLLVAIEVSLDAGEEVTQLGFFTSPGAFNGGRTLRGKESLNTGNECFSESQTIWSPIFTHRSLITTRQGRERAVRCHWWVSLCLQATMRRCHG